MKVGTDAVLLGAWTNVSGIDAILDIGAGSGIIALMLAQRNQKALIDAVEVDDESFLQCEDNFNASPWQERMGVFHEDIKQFTTGIKYSLVVSNPPFFSNSLLSGDERKDAARHTVNLSPAELIACSVKLLAEKGKMDFVLPADKEKEIKNEAAKYGFYTERICHVRYNPEKPVKRILIEFSKDAGKAMEEELCIRDNNEQFTPEYVKLTKEFYPFL